MTEIDNTLHDSLDLPELRQEIAVAQNLQKTLQKRSRYHYWALAGVAGLLVFAIVALEFSPTLTRRTTAVTKVALVGFTYIFYLPRILVAYREHKKYARRLANYAPQYVPRTTIWNTISVVVNHTFYIVSISLAFFINDTWLITHLTHQHPHPKSLSLRARDFNTLAAFAPLRPEGEGAGG